jgi:alkylhydroperoxidase family enzyme
MIQGIIIKKLDAMEKEVGVSMEYMRFVARTSLKAFLKFTKFLPLAAYRNKLPVGPINVARLVSSRHADCGPCVQIGVHFAKKDGVPDDVLRAVVDQHPENLTPELADVYHFVESIFSDSPDQERLRERMRERYGDEGLIEMSFAVASAQVFPMTKRVLGYATSCSKVKIAV